jgi:hypothetical protein
MYRNVAVCFKLMHRKLRCAGIAITKGPMPFTWNCLTSIDKAKNTIRPIDGIDLKSRFTTVTRFVGLG